MKPQQLTNDPSAIIECKRMIKGRIRQAFHATMFASNDNRSESLSSKTKGSYVDKVERLEQNVNTEDPIRTIMFLGSWSHT